MNPKDFGKKNSIYLARLHDTQKVYCDTWNGFKEPPRPLHRQFRPKTEAHGQRIVSSVKISVK